MENQKLTQAAKEARRKYLREWQRKNPDKVRAAQERYWLKKAKELEGGENHDGDHVDD